MNVAHRKERYASAIEAFDRFGSRFRGSEVVTNLSAGLSQIRDELFERFHEDVEKQIGMDSMLMPVSLVRGAVKAKTEIEIYQLVVADDEIVTGGYLQEETPGDVLRWLLNLRINDAYDDKVVQERIRLYRKQENAEQRRLSFSNAMEAAFPESRRAPLVLYRLFPLAARICAALAFGDNLRAAELRNEQIRLLPIIGDCHECHGRPLDNGESCSQCGNPLWKYKWLTSAD